MTRPDPEAPPPGKQPADPRPAAAPLPTADRVAEEPPPDVRWRLPTDPPPA
jgi:hypothetical protein